MSICFDTLTAIVRRKNGIGKQYRAIKICHGKLQIQAIKVGAFATEIKAMAYLLANDV